MQETLAKILEAMMIIGFGVSWPFAIYKSWKSKSTKGKSIVFMICIFVGYICGIISKFLFHNFNLAFWFYFPNTTLVFIDILLYFKNKKYEKEQELEDSYKS